MAAVYACVPSWLAALDLTTNRVFVLQFWILFVVWCLEQGSFDEIDHSGEWVLASSPGSVVYTLCAPSILLSYNGGIADTLRHVFFVRVAALF